MVNDSRPKIIRGMVITPSKIIQDGAVIVIGEKIEKIAKWDVIKQDYDTTIVIGSKESIVSPGFVNTHSHAVQTLFRGAADDRDLLDWLNQVILPGEATLTAHELYASCQLGYAEMIRSGITTTNDMLTANHSENGIQAAQDAGIRVKVGKMLMDRNVPDNLLGNTNEILEEADTLADKYPKGGLVEYAYTPRFVISCTDELMKKSAENARERGLTFHTHASENQGECNQVMKLTGSNNISALDRFGCLGNNSILAHCVHTNDQERQLLVDTNTGISHNPSSNAKLASGIAPIPDYLKRGLNVGLATDGSPATGGHDFFLEMKLASYLQKASTLNPTIMPAKTVFEMATIGGANALGYSDIGALKEGYKADIIVLDTNSPNAVPLYDPYSFIVYSANKGNISDVMVNGELLMENSELLQDISDSIKHGKKYALEKPFLTRT